MARRGMGGTRRILCSLDGAKRSLHSYLLAIGKNLLMRLGPKGGAGSLGQHTSSGAQLPHHAQVRGSRLGNKLLHLDPSYWPAQVPLLLHVKLLCS